MRGVALGIQEFKNVALQIMTSCRTDQTFMLRERIEFTQKEFGGHCVVTITRQEGDRIYWQVERLYYINPLLQ